MTLSSLAQAAGGSAPLEPSEVLAMDVHDLETTELIRRVHGLVHLQEAIGLLRAKYLREIRDRDFPITGRVGKEGDDNTRIGWGEFLKKEFGGKVRLGEANAEIRGLEALEAASKAIGAANSEQFGVPPAEPQKSVEINNSLLLELGMANGHGPKIAERILRGEVSGRQAVRQAVKDAKADAAVAGIQRVKPTAPPTVKSPKLPMRPPPGGITQKLDDYRGSPVAAKQRVEIEGMIERMRKAAVAYNNTVKKLGNYTRDAIAHDRRFPAHMTALAIVWKEEGFDMDDVLEQITKELAQASNEWGLAMDLLHGEANIIE